METLLQSKNFERGRRGPSEGSKRPIKEVERKGNNFWYNNNVNLKQKFLNNGNHLIYIEYHNL
jgi:hypothetical protein